ncbi:MAG TPA: hydrogenase maturation protease [Lutibacter sp.]|nr:hydrogenase maturation protease [Lutibacter sp.]
MKINKILLLGIGNCGRADDGLGWAFLDEIEKNLPTNIDLEYRYQLQVEDAELASHYEQVFFIDAHKSNLKNGFIIEQCKPIETHHFSTHELPPETVLYLTNQMYNKFPKSYLIGITGIEYKLKMGLSDLAKNNLQKAIHQFNKILKTKEPELTTKISI